MPDGKELMIRSTSAGLFHAREFSTAAAPADSTGVRSHTLLWASQDMPREDLVVAVEQRGWTQEEISKQLRLADSST